MLLRYWSASGSLAAVCLATAAMTGCVSAHGTNAEGHFVINYKVNPPEDVPEELRPYVERFENILRYHNYTITSVRDPDALDLKLNSNFRPRRVEVFLLQKGQILVEDYATPSMFSSNDSPDLLGKLVSKVANEFDGQLAGFNRQVVDTSSRQEAEAAAQATPSPDSDDVAVEFGTAFATNSPNTYVTARHVVDGATHISLHCGEGREADATVQAVDVSNDLVVLHSDLKAGAFLELAPNDSAQLGDHVFTVGFPTPTLLGIAPKYTDGAISALSGISDTFSLMQISVPIQPGNSGGPLVDTQGRVVGVIDSTAAVKSFYKISGGAIPQNVNFAVSSYYLYPLVKGIPRAPLGTLGKLSPVKRVTASLCLVVARMPAQ